jgi:hypothetical protein
MELRDYIAQIASTYDRLEGVSTPTQQLIRSADTQVGDYAPIGFITTGKAGAGVAATIPWFGFLDPDETTTPHEGLCVVYLFRADLESVWLTLIQRVTGLYGSLRPATAARARLREDGDRIRAQLGAARISTFERAIDLGATGRLPAGYEAGAVVAIEYVTSALPPEPVLRKDLQRMFALYQDAIAAKRTLLVTAPGSIATPGGSATDGSSAGDVFDHFKPKSSGDYVAHVEGGTFTRTRRHEALIAEYGEWARTQGFSALTEVHPRDLVLRRDSTEWLIEGEVLRRGNAAHAVREAIGQLFEYRRFEYTGQGKEAPELVGLFSEPIGNAYVELLDELGVHSVWRDGATWTGSAGAVEAGLGHALSL